MLLVALNEDLDNCLPPLTVNKSLLAVDVTAGKIREEVVAESLKRNNDDVLERLSKGAILVDRVTTPARFPTTSTK